MENPGTDDRLLQFLKSGIYRFENSTAVFIDPVRILNRSYTHFRVASSAYYSRFFEDTDPNSTHKPTEAQSGCRKRKRRKRKEPRPLNETEKIAQQRHQELRPFLLEAQKALLEATELLGVLASLRGNDCAEEECRESLPKRDFYELNFVHLASVWQAPLYEICIHLGEDDSSDRKLVPLFNNLISNEGEYDVEAEILNCRYILPKKSCFHMSDLLEIHNIVPDGPDSGFNLILIDPPWENSSAHQKMKYQTLPNRYFLSLPIKQLTHTSGALVALWVTNREKLRRFVENELFPEWGVKHAATIYWLKVKADGSLISELDVFHHRPYECLLLGYCSQKNVDADKLSAQKPLPDNQVYISIPGDYSRKPPVADLLLEYVPGYGHARCVELFARELTAGWTCWGNEPLHFQNTKYFLRRDM